MKKLFLNSSKAFLIILFSSIIDVNADEIFIKGKEVFLGAGNCAACHTLSDAGSNVNIGPNLNEIKPNISRILIFFPTSSAIPQENPTALVALFETISLTTVKICEKL